jgi:hypothetical protein
MDAFAHLVMPHKRLLEWVNTHWKGRLADAAVSRELQTY